MASFETTTKYVRGIESRYKKISNLNADMSVFPIKANQLTQVKTDIAKSKEFGEVFTPLWLVDMMISQTKIKSQEIKTLDLCAGYGQFSIRLMRYFYNKFDKNFDLKVFLKNHYFSELQLISCYKLLWIFGKQINLFIGDATKLHLLPEDAEGIWCYLDQVGKWVCLNKTIQKIFMPNPKQTISEEEFVFLIKKIIDELNKEYKKMEDRYSEVRKNKDARKVYIENIKKFFEKHYPDLKEQLPHFISSDLVKDMCNQIDELEIKNILVMFNWEFLEHLVFDKKNDLSQITFASEVEDFNKILAKLYGVNYITINLKNIAQFKKQFMNKKFDVCLSNPPYNDHLHLKILMALENVVDEFVVVHPSNWLIDRKGSSDLFVNFKGSISEKVKSLKLFNGNPIFKISLHVPCVISHYFTKVTYRNIKINYLGINFESNDIGDITKYGSNWINIVKPFILKMKKECVKDNIWSHELSHQKLSLSPDKEYCQIAAIRGHEDYSINSMVKDDFYTLVMKKSDNNKGIRKAMDKRPGPTYQFDTAQERDNFINYLKTDFARFCLSYLKIGQNVFYGEMALIPWMDFTQHWDDEKLFNHFNIDQKTQNYIREFLPDYYGFRKLNPNKDGSLTNAA